MANKKNIIVCWNDNSVQTEYLQKQIKDIENKINSEKQRIRDGIGVTHPFLDYLRVQIETKSSRSAIVDTMKRNIDLPPFEYENHPDLSIARSILKSFSERKSNDIIAVRKILKALFNEKITKANEENAAKIVEYDINLCTSYLALSQNDFSTIDGLIMLCELSWDCHGSDYSPTRFSGVDLVQFLREEPNHLRAPVVFVSILSQDTIVSSKRDAEIIRTPALQHGFVRLPSKLEDIVKKLDVMRPQNAVEIKYTQLQYCDPAGLLTQISHAIGSSSGEVEKEYKEQIKYILKKFFNNDKTLLTEYQQHDSDHTLGVFCKKLYNLLNNTQRNETDSDIDLNYACNSDKSNLIKIAYLEDDVEHDANAKRFVNYIENETHKYKKKGYDFLFKLRCFSDPDQLKQQYDKFDVIICDIMLKKDNQLVALGFNIIKDLMLLPKRPLYYIVTNVTRSFYDQLMMPGIQRIRLKEEVFGSEETISKFLYGIKEVWDNRMVDEEKADYLMVFSELMKNVRNDPQYPHRFKKTLFQVKELTSYKELEDIVQVQSMVLIKLFLKEWREKILEKAFENYYLAFDKVSETMRDYVKNNIGLGNGRLIDDLVVKFRRGENPSSENIKNFMIRLILRRYFLFLRELAKEYNLALAYNNEVSEKKYKCSNSEFVCRAISEQYRDEAKELTQSRCLDETLLYSLAIENEDEDAQLTAEEIDFVRTIRIKKPFRFSTIKQIESLDLY